MAVEGDGHQFPRFQMDSDKGEKVRQVDFDVGMKVRQEGFDEVGTVEH